MTFYLKKGDTKPAYTDTLTSGGSAINLSGCQVKFQMEKKPRGVSKVDSSATITNASNGEVKYNWSTADIDETGKYRAEWEVTFGDGSVRTIPREDYLSIKIVEDV